MRARKPIVTQEKAIVTEDGDIHQLKRVIRKLLEKLESMIDTKEEGEQERLCGAKHSLADTLVTLADLMLRLTMPPETVAVATEVKVDADDVAMVERFVRRMRGQD